MNFSIRESKRVGFDQGGNLITELKLVEDLLHVRGEAVQESLEIGSELLLLAPGGEIAQAEGGRVIEGLAGRLAERSVLIGDAGPVELTFHLERGLFGRLEYRIQTPNDRHRQNDVSITCLAHRRRAAHRQRCSR